MLIIASYIIVFVALSGVLAMVDAALLSVSRVEIEEMIMHKRWGARSLKAIKRRITRAIVIVVIVTNTINVLGPILVGQKAIDIYGKGVIGVITVLLVLGTIVFSEIVPKSLGTHYSPIVGRVSAPIILAVIYMLYPLVILLDSLSKLLMRGERRLGTENQIRSLVLIGRRRGHIEQDESRMIHRAFFLNDRTAKDLMTPAARVVAVQESASIREAADQVICHEFSRYPVFGRSPDDVRGIVLSRDILERVTENRGADPVTTIMRESLIVDASDRSDHLLVLFRDKHVHLAIVQETGKTLGVVTLEDVLEELVGEIRDEKDVSILATESVDPQ